MIEPSEKASSAAGVGAEDLTGAFMGRIARSNKIDRVAIGGLALVAIIAAFFASGCSGEKPGTEEKAPNAATKSEAASGSGKAGGAKRAKGKKVLMIIAPKDFRDEEYQKPREILENAGASVTVASATTEEATGMLGLKVKPDIALSQVKVAEYDAVIFVGGGGATAYFGDESALSIAREAASSKLVGAICLAPQILANAGALNGKKATVFDSQVESIKAKGARYTGATVEKDGNIITGNGPEAAEEFGNALLDALF